MSMETTAANQSGGTDRRIESDRLSRTLTEDLTVRDAGQLQYLVGHADRTQEYLVDVEMGTCECEDYQFRGHSVYCKHVLRACIHHAFRSSSNTALVARALQKVRDDGCPKGVRGCAGPTTLGARGYPCPGCVAATSSGDWTVWTALVGRNGR